MKKTKELLLTGGRVKADAAERIGLVNKSAPPAELLDEAKKMARQLVMIPPPAMELNKKAINHSYDIRGFLATIDYGAEMFSLVQMSESEESKEFFAIAAEKGLKAAFKWRDEKFSVGR